MNRLKPILPNIISPTQSSFILGQQILNNIVVVKEVLYSMRSRAKGKIWVIIKIDLEKAYDRVRWEFLEDIVRAAHFLDSLVRVIMNCQSLGKTKLLWNGGVVGEFQATRGVRQGDPLSPYLFVLCMEILTHLIQAIVDAGLWRPVRVGGVPLSHFFFTEDLILFAKADLDPVAIIKSCLNLFCEASGERVNYAKSSIMVGKICFISYIKPN